MCYPYPWCIQWYHWLSLWWRSSGSFPLLSCQSQITSLHGWYRPSLLPLAMPILWHCPVHKKNLLIRSLQIALVLFSIPPYPSPSIISDTTLFFCACESTTVSYKTIKVYLAAIILNHIECGMTDWKVDGALQLVCRGIHRLQGNSQRTCLPIIVNLMGTLKEQPWLSQYTVKEQRMLWAAYTLIAKPLHIYQNTTEWLMAANVICIVDATRMVTFTAITGSALCFLTYPQLDQNNFHQIEQNTCNWTFSLHTLYTLRGLSAE